MPSIHIHQLVPFFLVPPSPLFSSLPFPFVLVFITHSYDSSNRRGTDFFFVLSAQSQQINFHIWTHLPLYFSASAWPSTFISVKGSFHLFSSKPTRWSLRHCGRRRYGQPASNGMLMLGGEGGDHKEDETNGWMDDLMQKWTDEWNVCTEMNGIELNDSVKAYCRRQLCSLCFFWA